jgi:hypothetical protein
MFRSLLGAVAILGALIAPAAAKDLGGVVIAAPGSNVVAGTKILFCPWDGQAANCEAYAPLEIRGGGTFKTFKMTGVPEGEYRILAYRDVNRSGEFDGGDEAALFSEYPYNEPRNVRPGRLDIALRLIPYDGDATQLLPGQRRDQQRFEGIIPVPASELVGRWGGTGPIANHYNTVTGAYAGTSWSSSGIEFRANGTYESADLFQGTSRCMVYVDKGRYRIAGGSILLTPTRLEQFVCGRGETTTTRSGSVGVTTTMAWRFYYYAGSGLKFQLIDRVKLRDERDWYYATDYTVGAR